MSIIENEVARKILTRAELGLKKYGTSMERNDLEELDWLKHTQEELMDACVYIERLIQDKEKELKKRSLEKLISERDIEKEFGII
jgi:hypothetical protein